MAKRTVEPRVMQGVYDAIPYLLRLPSGKVSIDYDQEADVLYLSLKRPQQATDSTYADDEGVLLRYRGDELVGITVFEASKRGAAATESPEARAQK